MNCKNRDFCKSFEFFIPYHGKGMPSFIDLFLTRGPPDNQNTIRKKVCNFSYQAIFVPYKMLKNNKLLPKETKEIIKSAKNA